MNTSAYCFQCRLLLNMVLRGLTENKMLALFGAVKTLFIVIKDIQSGWTLVH